MEGLCVNFSIKVCFCCMCVCLFVLRVTDCIYFGCGVQFIYTCDHFHFHDGGDEGSAFIYKATICYIIH